MEGAGLGATYLGEGRCRFRLWAPFAEMAWVHILGPQERVIALERGELGYHQAVAEGVEPGSLYLCRLGVGSERPDPASRFQPRGVHGPSQVVDPRFPWTDGGWTGLPLDGLIIYELHVGTYTREGVFDAIIPHLDGLRDLGVTAVELMPVAQFPGDRNWGYDGVCPFAVQDSYGGPQGLKRLVDACHQRGMALVLDVVYNHLGPEGNYLGDFGPYFTERYRTPWGPALNFDGPYSDEVRRFFIENALYWITEFHVDALRLDAVHAILDITPQPFLEELAQAVHGAAGAMGRRVYLFPESSANDRRLITPPDRGGYDMDALWSDDFHHALHTLLTGDRTGYYQDYGSLAHLARAMKEGFAYTGQYSPYRGRRHGTRSRDIPANRFIVCAQNHDQVGNRMLGERLGHLVPFEAQKLAAAVVLLSPFIPLLFMGEEYGETAPFQYFVSHSDPELVEAVRLGREGEFRSFQWGGPLPDPQDEATFLRSRCNQELRTQGVHRTLWEYYREVIRLRRELPPLSYLSKETMDVLANEEPRVLFLRRWYGGREVAGVFHFGHTPASVVLPVPAGRWRTALDTAAKRWLGPGSAVPPELASAGEVELALAPWAAVLLARTEEG